MDNYPNLPPKLVVYRNQAGETCSGYLVGMLTSLSVYTNKHTGEQEIGSIVHGKLDTN